MAWIQFGTVNNIDVAEDINQDIWEETRVVSLQFDQNDFRLERWTEEEFGWEEVGEYTEDNVGDVLHSFDGDIDNEDYRSIFDYETDRFLIERRVE